jgi:hypothetical protein
MADEGKYGGMSSDEFKKLGEDAISLQTSLNSISSLLKQNATELTKATGDSAKAFADSFNEAEKLSKLVSKTDGESLKNKSTQANLAKQITKSQSEIVKVQRAANVARQRALVATGKEKTKLEGIAKLLQEGASAIGEQVEGAKKLTSEVKKIDKKVQFFDDMAELTSQVPLIGKLFSDFSIAAKKAREAAEAGESSFKVFGKALGEYAKFAGKAITAGTLGLLVKGLTTLDKSSVELSRNLIISKEAAGDLSYEMSSIAGVSMEAANKALMTMNAQLGTSVKFTKEEVALFSTLTDKLGFSAEQAGRLKLLAESTGKNFEEFTAELNGSAMLMTTMSNSALNYRDVMKEASSASAAVQISTANQGKNLIKAAFAAKSMGLSMSQLESIGSNLLNFEESIAAEMEAELLTGKQLNLEEARRAALNGDMAKLAGELTKQGITRNKFEGMNVIQQEAIAKAMGMSREEMAKSLLTQEAIKNINDKNVKTQSDLTRYVKDEMVRISQIEDIEKRRSAEKELMKKVGNEDLINQQKNLAVQEAFTNALNKIAIILGKQLLPFFQKLTNFMTSLEDGSNSLGVTFKGIASTLALIAGGTIGFKLFKLFKGIRTFTKGIGGNIGNIGKALSGLVGGGAAAGKVTSATMKGTGKVIHGAAAQSAVKAGTAVAGKSLAKTAGKGLLKAGIKKIPIIGALAGIGFGISRAMDGDLLGAGLEVASGVASIFPGLGTAASVGIDVGLAARDISGASGRSAQPQNDFIMRPGQPAQPFNSGDTIVGALNPSSIGSSAEVVAAVNRLNDTWERYIRLSTNGIITSYQMQ